MSPWRRRTTKVQFWLVLVASGGIVLLLGEMGQALCQAFLQGGEQRPLAEPDIEEAPWMAPESVSSSARADGTFRPGASPLLQAEGMPASPSGLEVGFAPPPAEDTLAPFSPLPPLQAHWKPMVRNVAERPAEGPPEGWDAQARADRMALLSPPRVPRTVSSQSPTPLPQQRSIHLERVARQADQHTQRGFELAGRRAYFSARAEFLGALRLVAEGLDREYRTQQHSQALRQGLTALEEADDLISSGVGEGFDLRAIVAGHTTPVLRQAPWESLTPMEALQWYLTYAQEQLALAAGQEVAGSMALHALGKLYGAMANQPALGLKGAEPKAMAFYQAALLVDPYNFMAANDLGVLLARSGWYEEAGEALLYSLAITSHPVGWRNLAIVYRQMGQYDLALRAARQWQTLHQQQLASRQDQAESAGVVVQWVAPDRFAAITGDDPGIPYGGPTKGATPAPIHSAPHPPAGLSPDFGPSSSPPGKFSQNENSAVPSLPNTKPGPILANLLRGPFSLFREHSQRADPGDSGDWRRPSENSSPYEQERPSRVTDPSPKTPFR